MKKNITIAIILLIFSFSSYSQSITDIINEVSIDSLEFKIKEFTGEQSTIVNGNTVTIRNRQQANNDVAAAYLKQRFEGMDNISVAEQNFNSRGKNIIATQLGKTNPDDIYIVCAHYDTVADYCADDNASGTIAVLEIARILSTQCLDNTIIYALWDEEEGGPTNGLAGSRYYANQASNNGDNILGVLNIDMMGYDGNDDNKFDIDVQNIAGSVAMKNDILSVFNSYSFGNLDPITVNPGTPASDHSSFWNEGYSAVLVGESWETNDQTPFYHSSRDREATIDMPYYTELAKLVTAYMVTKGSLVSVDNTVSLSGNVLTANETAANYQWINCDTNSPISGATNQSYTPTSTGSYAVELTSGTCTEVSKCFEIDLLGVNTFSAGEINLYPNPVKTVLNIEMTASKDYTFNIYDTGGKLILKRESSVLNSTLNLKDLSKGVYFLNVETSEKSGTFKIIKE